MTQNFTPPDDSDDEYDNPYTQLYAKARGEGTHAVAVPELDHVTIGAEAHPVADQPEIVKLTHETPAPPPRHLVEDNFWVRDPPEIAITVHFKACDPAVETLTSYYYDDEELEVTYSFTDGTEITLPDILPTGVHHSPAELDGMPHVTFDYVGFPPRDPEPAPSFTHRYYHD